MTSISDINIVTTLFYLVGGLGLFLYGIDLMGDSLKNLAGEKLKDIIEKFTSTPLKGIFVGFLVTVVIQSSSATTALTIGLVRSGLMSFPQAIGIILGANIGTTATAFLIGLDIEAYALPIMGIGAIMFFFFKKQNIKNLGLVILGFGLLFYGLDLMSTGLKPLANTSEAYALFTSVSNHPILGLLVGAGFTAVIQSSSAAIGILQALYPLGVIPLRGTLAILLGSNVGTTITAVFASAGGSSEAKRTTVVHVLFNVLGAALFLLLLDVVYVPVANYIESNILGAVEGVHPSMTIALSHTFFNVAMAMIMYPFIGKLVALANKIVKGETRNPHFVELEEMNLIEASNSIAISFVKERVVDMAILTKEMFDNSYQYIFDNKQDLFDLSVKQEDLTDSYEHLIHNYLYQLTGNGLNHHETDQVNRYLSTINDLERIGDLCTNIFEFSKVNHQSGKEYSAKGQRDIKRIYEVMTVMSRRTVIAFKTSDKALARLVIDDEEVIDELYEKLRDKHFSRLSRKTCSYHENYIDLLNNLERISDHMNNICEKIAIDDYYARLAAASLDDDDDEIMDRL